MQQAAFLNKARAVQRVVVRRQIQIDRGGDIDTAPGVAANIGKEQTGFAAAIDRESNPWQVHHWHARQFELGTPGLSVARRGVNFQGLGMHDPIGIIGWAVAHTAVFNLDPSIGQPRQLISGTRHAAVVQYEVGVIDIRDFGPTVVGHLVTANQHAGFSQGHMAGSNRCLLGSVDLDPICSDYAVTLLDPDITLEYGIGLGHFGFGCRDLEFGIQRRNRSINTCQRVYISSFTLATALVAFLFRNLYQRLPVEVGTNPGLNQFFCPTGHAR